MYLLLFNHVLPHAAFFFPHFNGLMHFVNLNFSNYVKLVCSGVGGGGAGGTSTPPKAVACRGLVMPGATA